MSTIITQPAREAHPDLDAAARKRADRLVCTVIQDEDEGVIRSEHVRV